VSPTPTLVQCGGTTLKGKRCARTKKLSAMGAHGGWFCHDHNHVRNSLHQSGYYACGVHLVEFSSVLTCLIVLANKRSNIRVVNPHCCAIRRHYSEWQVSQERSTITHCGRTSRMVPFPHSAACERSWFVGVQSKIHVGN
jgi:hypothetical protein